MSVIDRPSARKPQPRPLLNVEILRSMFRALHEFRSLYEDRGIDTINDPEGNPWSIWDIEYLYSESQRILPPRQADSIRLFLVENLPESQVAQHFGTAPTNPVGMYATEGLKHICALVQRGALQRFREGG